MLRAGAQIIQIFSDPWVNIPTGWPKRWPGCWGYRAPGEKTAELEGRVGGPPGALGAQQLSALAAGQGQSHPGPARPGPGRSEWKTTWPQTIDKGARAGRPSAAHARAQRGQSRARPRPPWDPRRRGPDAARGSGAGRPWRPRGCVAGGRDPRGEGCRLLGRGGRGEGWRSDSSGEVGSAEAATPGPRWRGELCSRHGSYGHAGNLIHVTFYRWKTKAQRGKVA